MIKFTTNSRYTIQMIDCYNRLFQKMGGKLKIIKAWRRDATFFSYRAGSASFLKKMLEGGGKKQKKPDESPRENVGSAKNPLPETTEKRPARHEDTIGLAGCISFSGSKRACLKFGGFTFSFAEITDVMSSESDP